MTPALTAVGGRLARLVLATIALLAPVNLAEAHRLKMFVTVEDGEISGYAFFIGGGRPTGADVVVKDATGAPVHRGETDDHGTFRWRPPAAADFTVAVDAGDGHWIEGGIAADRFGAAAAVSTPVPAEPIAPAVVPGPGARADASPMPASLACPAPIDPAVLARLVESRVDEVVARRLRPLIEAQTQAEGRLRFNDVMGGVGMIVGLAGAALWARARRRRATEAT